jgi:putative radical SAM enzyme (TIGR03279 family)
LLEICSVLPGSLGADLGFKQGDRIVSINGEDVNDVIDYKFSVADEHVVIIVQEKNGGRRTYTIDKDADDALGLEFPPLHIKQCRNKCIFCFVDQMPKGCRKSLYIKDDDFRASFLHGNYITLGSLTESDFERIFQQRLSPLYISVHTTEPALRSFIIGNKRAPEIMTSMKRLAAGGIKMHTQIVLCPGVNDGPYLERTLDDLSGMFPAVASVAVVPVGITAFRKELYPLRTFTLREAREVLATTEMFGKEFKKQFGSRLVFASDEFYIRAKVAFPSPSFYEDFPQIENGVGMVTTFLREASRTRLPSRISPLHVTVATGISFGKILKQVLTRIQTIRGVSVDLATVKNYYFGPSVTVAGLLTGGDILKALQHRRLGDVLVIPASMLKEDEDVFLDNMTLKQLEKRLDIKIIPAATFRELMLVLRSEGRGFS